LMKSIFCLVALVVCVISAKKCDNVKLMKRQVEHMFTSVQYPNCLAVSQDPSRATWFSQNVQARVLPLGQFTGIQGNVEYLYGLTCPTQSPDGTYYLALKSNTLQFLMVEDNMASFKSLGQEFLMAGSDPANLQFTNVNLLNLTYMGYAAFDEDCQICGYEVSLPHPELTFPLPTDAPSQLALIEQLCGATQLYCQGANTQWNDVYQCIGALSQIAFSNLADGDQNTISCRLIHIRLAAVNPTVHCPHVGPTGGNACYNKDPNIYANQNFFGCARKVPHAMVVEDEPATAKGLTIVEETSIIVAGVVVVILAVSFLIGFFMFKKSRKVDQETIPLNKF